MRIYLYFIVAALCTASNNILHATQVCVQKQQPKALINYIFDQHRVASGEDSSFEDLLDIFSNWASPGIENDSAVSHFHGAINKHQEFLNQKTKDGYTLAMVATSSEYFLLVKYLIDAGTDVFINDPAGRDLEWYILRAKAEYTKKKQDKLNNPKSAKNVDYYDKVLKVLDTIEQLIHEKKEACEKQRLSYARHIVAPEIESGIDIPLAVAGLVGEYSAQYSEVPSEDALKKALQKKQAAKKVIPALK